MLSTYYCTKVIVQTNLFGDASPVDWFSFISSNWEIGLNVGYWPPQSDMTQVCNSLHMPSTLWVLSISNVCYSPHSPLKDVLCQQRRGKGIEPITSRVWKYCKFDQERGKDWGHLSVGVDRSNFRGMFDLVHLIYGNGFLKTKVCWINFHHHYILWGKK